MLGACGSTPAATTTTSTSTTLAPSTSSTSTTVAPAPPCATALLGLTGSSGSASAGTSYAKFTFTNRSTTPCSLTGYPTVKFFGTSGASGAGAGTQLSLTPIPTGPTHGAVTLEAQGTAEFLVVFSDVPLGGVGCIDVASVEVTPPGSNEAISAPLSISPCGAAVEVQPVGPAGSENP